MTVAYGKSQMSQFGNVKQIGIHIILRIKKEKWIKNKAWKATLIWHIIGLFSRARCPVPISNASFHSLSHSKWVVEVGGVSEWEVWW